MSPDCLFFEALAPNGPVIAGFSVRDSPQERENMALHVKDDPHKVRANRKRLCRRLGIPFDAYTCAEQIHGSRVESITCGDRGRGRLSQNDVIPGCDALITNEPGIMLNIFVADCVPIILYDKTSRSGGVCHAGWRGTAKNILLRTVESMKVLYGSNPDTITALIGPSIGVCCYKVGEGVKVAMEENLAYPVSPFEEKKDGLYCNLKLANHAQLLLSGLKEENIHTSPDCTCCSGRNYYSYRKSGEQSGRFSAFFYLRESELTI